MLPSFINNFLNGLKIKRPHTDSDKDKIIESLMAEITLLKAKVAKLVEENIALKEKLGLNSSNSSLPPSSDRNKAKPKTRKASGRKQGAQLGHKGVKRKLVPVEMVNKVVQCMPEEMCECGGMVVLSDKNPYRHQVTELPEIKPIITEYQLYCGTCQRCKHNSYAELPADVGNNVLGPRAMALLAQLSSKYHLSKRLIQEFFHKSLGIQISLGTVSNTEKRVSDSLASIYETLKASLLKEEHLNIDETGHKEKSKRGYVWVFTSNTLCVFVAKLTRAKSVLVETLSNFKGKITSDRYAAYNFIPTPNRQSCWAHLIRDFKRFANSEYADVAAIGVKLLENSEKLFDLRNQLKTAKISREKFLAEMSKVKINVEKFLERGSKMLIRKQFSNSCTNIYNLRSTLWLFVEKPGIEPTNNLAERQLRPYVIWRKLSFGTQSERGSRFIERIMSVSVTYSQTGIIVFDALVKAITDHVRTVRSPPAL